MNILSDMGGRKFLFAVLIAVAGYGAMLAGKMTPQEWNGLVVWCFGIFSAANVTQSVSNVISKNK